MTTESPTCSYNLSTDFVDAPFADALLEIGRRRDDVVVLCADLSKYTDVRAFAETFPDRFVQVGMAEQNMMGIAGGLMRCDLVPIAVTYGVFATRRAGEQIQMALATGTRRTAVVVAFLPGITTPFRATHQATDDLSIMRAVPGMTVIDPMDATEMAGSIAAAVASPGPVYLRGLRGSVRRILAAPGDGFAIGPARLLRTGNDIGLIGTGLGSEWALEAASNMNDAGIQAGVLHVPTVKPLDLAGIRDFAAAYEVVLTVENHSVVGGLGSAVCEALAEIPTRTVVHRLGVPDVWAPSGPLDYIREHLSLTGAGITRTACDLIWPGRYE